MKLLKIGIELKVKGDENDEEGLKASVYEYIQELMDSDDLEFEILEIEEEEDCEN